MSRVIRLTMGFILFINFVYRFIRMVRKISRQTYHEDTIHRFQCKKCGGIHTMNGPEAKKIRFRPQVRKSTPLSQSRAYIFKCPLCEERTSQTILYDQNKTYGLGMIRLQLNEEQIPLIIDFLLKGVLPYFIFASISRFFS